MSRRKGFPRIVKTVRPFTAEHPVFQSIGRGSQWFDASVAQMTTPYGKISKRTGIAAARLNEFSRGVRPAPQEVELLAILCYVTPESLSASFDKWRDLQT